MTGKQEELYLCNDYGDYIFDGGIATSSTSTVNKKLLIYDKGVTGLASQTINYFNSNSDSFTFSFTPAIGGVRVNSAKVTITYEVDLPNTPTPTLTASATSASDIRLNWNRISNATSYEIYNCDTNQRVTTTSSTNYTVTGLNANTRYRYKIRAMNADGKSTFSSCKYATTRALPNIPTLTASTSSSSSIRLSWNQISNATSYEIYNCANNQKIRTTSSTNYTVTGLITNTRYGYKIRAVNSDGSSDFSSCKYTTTSNSIPNTPTLSASAASSTSIKLSWNRISNATSYELFSCDTNAQITTTTSREYIVTGLSNETQYGYKIMAVNTLGNSNFSSCKNATTLPGPPNTPSQISASNVTSFSVDLAWTVAVNATSYEIYNCDTNQRVTTTSSTNYKAMGLYPNASYRYKVRAINSSGSSGFTSCVYFETPELNKPSQLVITEINTSNVRLIWIGANNATGYDVYNCTTDQRIARTTNTYFTNYQLSPNTEYHYKVKAIYSNGNSGFTPCVNVTTKKEICDYNEPIDINNNTINSDSVFQTTDIINISGSTFETGNTIVVKSGSSIKITPNTRIESGSRTRLAIELCDNNNNNKRNFKRPIAIQDTPIITMDRQEEFLNSLHEEGTDKTESKKSEIRVYPNPSTQYVSINLDSEYIGGEITLLNLSNKVILKKNISNTPIVNLDLTAVSSGLYIVRITKKNSVVHLKLVKK